MVQSYCLLVSYEIVKLHKKVHPVLFTCKRRLVSTAESQEWDQPVPQVRAGSLGCGIVPVISVSK